MPTPLTDEEAAALTVALDVFGDAEEAFIEAEAALKLAQHRFQRKDRALRIAHGAGGNVAWDGAAKKWVQIPGQPAAPRAIEPLISSEGG